MQELQVDLLTTYRTIEQKIRSWHPGCKWDQGELAALKAAQKSRDDLEQLLLQILTTTRGGAGCECTRS